MVDLAAQVAELQPALDLALSRVLRGGAFILGPEVRAFEIEAAAYLGVGFTTGCASGTDALHLALRAAGVGPGDEVITTPFSFIATAEAIVYTGARPVFVDIDPATFNITTEAVAAALSPRTRAILPVHLFGQPAEAQAMRALADHHGLTLIEDAAQAFGAELHCGEAPGAPGTRKVGSIGHLACFSFYPSKNLGAFGDGGLVVTSDPALHARLRLLREHGHEGGYRHSVIGYNSRLDELQAAALRLKLPRLDGWNERRRQAAARYDAGLHALGVTPPPVAPGRRHVYHQYTLRSGDRDRLRAALAAEGIASAVYYPIPIHRQASFAAHGDGRHLPEAERAAAEVLSLPIHPHLQPADQDRVIAALAAAH